MINTLLVDTNRGSIPIYEELIKLGHKVTVVGRDSNEPLARVCNNFTSLDYSNVDELRNFIQEKNFNFFIPGCTDLSYRVLSEIMGGSNNIDELIKCRTIFDKEKFKKLANNLNLSVPNTITKDNINDFKDIIIKPIDSHSGIGIERIKSPTLDKVETSINNSKIKAKSEDIIIEEYIDGQLYSHSAVIKDNSIIEDFFIKEDNSKGYFHVDTSCVADNLETGIINGIRREVNLIIRKLSLTSGIFHTQFIRKGSNFYLLECTRRCPGDLYSLLVKLSTGYNFAKSYLSSFINESIYQYKNQEKYIIRHTIYDDSGLFSSLNFKYPVKLVSFYPLISTFELASTRGKRVAICFFESETLEEHNNLYKIIMERKLYEFD